MYVKRINEHLLVPVAENLGDAYLLVKSDFYRYSGKFPRGREIALAIVANPSFAFSFFLRFSSINWFGRPMMKFFKTLIGRKRGLMISEKMPIGYGFYLAHAFGVIINPSAIIGNNVTISQFTTIGSMKNTAAIIGNDVYIGPAVCVVENQVVGERSVIGAGAVVVKDIPGNVTAAGVPAVVISNNNSRRLICNRFPYENYICN